MRNFEFKIPGFTVKTTHVSENPRPHVDIKITPKTNIDIELGNKTITVNNVEYFHRLYIGETVFNKKGTYQLIHKDFSLHRQDIILVDFSSIESLNYEEVMIIRDTIAKTIFPKLKFGTVKVD